MKYKHFITIIQNGVMFEGRENLRMKLRRKYVGDSTTCVSLASDSCVTH